MKTIMVHKNVAEIFRGLIQIQLIDKPKSMQELISNWK